MVSSISSTLPLSPSLPVSSLAALGESPKPPPSERELETREKFQEFVAGTFYKQMLKSLRSTQGKPAYFHGGQAEEVFRSQLDQHITDDLARSRGGSFADPLFSVYARQRPGL